MMTLKTRGVAILMSLAITGCNANSINANETGTNRLTESNKALTNLQSAKLFANLPANCPTPDAFALAPNGTITLTCPNFADRTKEGILLSLSTMRDVSFLANVPRLSKKTKANPMGIAYDNEGNLYVADSRGPKNGRVLVMSFDGNELVKTEIVASGLNPNGIRYHDGFIYVTQPVMPKLKSDFSVSGIYRFSINQRDAVMTNTYDDEELIFTVETKNPSRKMGLDGLAFGPDDKLYTVSLGDGDIYRLALSEAGKVKDHEIIGKIETDAAIDGIVFDNQDNLFMAGFANNQIFKLSNATSKNANINLIADYPDNDGSNGQLDQPADLLYYDGKLLISNFDLLKGKGFENSQHDKPFTISYLDIEM